MAAPFATPADLADRWRPLTPAEEATATVLLGDASAMIRAECPDIDARLVPVPPATLPELDPTVPTMVACAMVKRSMNAGDMAGLKSRQESMGPFAQSLAPVNPNGDLYMTKAERRALGCGGQQAFTVSMAPQAGTVHRPWCSLAFGATYCSCGADIAGHPIYEA